MEYKRKKRDNIDYLILYEDDNIKALKRIEKWFNSPDRISYHYYNKRSGARISWGDLSRLERYLSYLGIEIANKEIDSEI